MYQQSEIKPEKPASKAGTSGTARSCLFNETLIDLQGKIIQMWHMNRAKILA